MAGNGTRQSALGRLWDWLWMSPRPTLACEISQEGISLARWQTGSSRLETASWRPLPEGTVEASPLHENIRQPEEAQAAFIAAAGALGLAGRNGSGRPLDAVLVIPDQAARLFVLNFDTLPDKPRDALSLVKWRLKKSVPFSMESAAVSYFVQRQGKTLQVVAVATPLAVLRQYESLAEGAGLRPRSVTLSTLAALSLAPPAPQASDGILVAKCSPPWFTTAILQEGHLRLFRTVGMETEDGGQLSPSRVIEGIYPSVVYFQDNFGGALRRACLSGMGSNRAAIEESLRREMDLEPSPLAPELEELAGMEAAAAERRFASLLGVAGEQRHA